MAADPSPDWLSSLPDSWGFGITQGGRVFFINEEAKSTTWLHPVTGEAILTGHRKTPDLPTGWEEGFTFEGARYYINHNERKVTCRHPVTGQPSQDNCIFVVNDQASCTMASQEKKDRTVSMTSETSSGNPAGHPTSPITRSSRTSGKLHNFGKRSNSIKRNPNAPVTMRSWLYKKANSGMKLWKKRWFVLSDLCLFYYRDEKEEGVLGSILLPSFKISPITADDHINRVYAFKAAHPNMRTYYFCTDTGREMELWMKAMTDASLVHTEPTKRIEVAAFENVAPQESNHVPNHRLLIRPETNNNQRNSEVSKVEEKRAREAERYGFQKDGQERPLTKINSARQQPGDYELPAASAARYRSAHINGPDDRYIETQGHASETDSANQHRAPGAHMEPERVIQRTNSMLQLEQWIRSQREKSPEEDGRGVMSYQTLPRNMPSYRAHVVPRYPEGYRTLPRNPKSRPESLCSTAGAGYERTAGPPCAGTEEKRRSIRDDTMWQLYEWQQRQFYNKQTTLRRHSSLNSPKTMIHISEQTLHSVPLSPSHGSISGYHTYSPHRAYRSEVSSPVQRGDLTIDRRQKTLPNKLTFHPDRRSMPAGLSLQPVSPQGLHDKTPEELTLLLIKLRRQQAELGTVREHTLAQLLRLKQLCSPKDEILSHHLQRNLIYVDYQMAQEDCRAPYKCRTEEADVDAKLSRLCEQDKVVQALEQKLQQLHQEKHTLEQALLSASQEIEMKAENPAAVQSVLLQRDDLQNGLLSTCREVSRATAELERAWRDYDRLERDVTTARKQMRDQLDRLGEVQTESAGIQRAQMQKEIWRIQDVMEGLSKHKEQREADAGNSDSKPATSGKNPIEEKEAAPPRPPLPRSYDFSEQPPTIPLLPGDGGSYPPGPGRGPVRLPDEKTTHHVQIYQRNGSYCGPDYRLYKSEPELTTVAEVDESNGEDRADASLDMENGGGKGPHFPVGVVPPRAKSPPPLESTTIASYVTLRKNRKPEYKSERPRSAVEHLCIAESPRPRMTVEEQLERMRRHQQACLKEKKRGFSFLGATEQSPSQSPAFSRESSSQASLIRKREEKLCSDMKDLESAAHEAADQQQRETPAQEITRLKEAADKRPPDRQEGDLSETFLDTKEERRKDVAGDGDLGDKIKAPVPNCSESANHQSNSERRLAAGQECAGILFSYEFPADTLRRHAELEGNLSSLPEHPTLAAPVPQTQLTETSHFMCV
ncbi:pleckstrin homology domain-containing family A member 5 isoform X2 [Spea bombifrons]|uniref:pleckstrin homology domain-containing family A member 5 isoform X2 n=1 Tax=Spea bombifrons TaxID=233779 RepID=UPI00234A2C07|nr:pleckstrin homology domain-containing family A member 5 isoform X2 [Spea bombifrons]